MKIYKYHEKSKRLYTKKVFETTWYKEAKDANFESGCGWTQGDQNTTPAFVVVRNHGKKVVVAATSETGDVEYRYIIQNSVLKKVLVREYRYSYFGDGEYHWLVQELNHAPYLEWVDEEGNINFLGGFNIP